MFYKKLPLFVLFAAVASFCYTQALHAGAVGPWVGNLNPAGSLVYYGTGAYGASLSKMGVQALPTGSQIWASAVSPTSLALKSNSTLGFGAQQVGVAINGTVAAAGVFTAVKAIMGGPIGIAVTALTVAPAVVEWLRAKDIRFAPVVPATGEQFERRSAGCTAKCEQTSYAPEGPWFDSDASACAAYAGTLPPARGTIPGTVNPNYAECTPTYFINGIYYDQSFKGFYRRIAPPTAESWTPASIEQIRADMEANPFKPAVVDAVIASGGEVPITYAPDAVSGPVSVTSPPVVSRSTSGETTTTTTTGTKTDITYGVGPSPADGRPVPIVTGSTNTTTNTSITNNSTGVTTNSSSTVNNVLAPQVNAPPPAEKIIVCGLPDTPACRLDELDTPKPDPLIDGKKITDDITKPLKDFAANPEKALPQLPRLNWAFTLPSGCVPISIPAFAPFLQTIDVCQFQPMFHDVMSMVWVMGALFGAISMFWRNTLSQS